MLRASNEAIAAAARAGDCTLEVKGLSIKVTTLAYMGEWIAANQAVEELQAKLSGFADEVVRAYALGDVAFF